MSLSVSRLSLVESDPTVQLVQVGGDGANPGVLHWRECLFLISALSSLIFQSDSVYLCECMYIDFTKLATDVFFPALKYHNGSNIHNDNIDI